MKHRTLLLSLPFGVAAGAALYFLMKKHSSPEGHSENAKKADVPAVPKTVGEGSYSFISGFKDASTVELRLSYDADRFTFRVAEDEFLLESGDSHVGLLEGEGFSLQFEYAGYYRGEDFEKLRAVLAERHADLCPVRFGENGGLRYLAGDNLCYVFPIPEDPYSYLLVSLIKARDNDDDLDTVAEYPELRYVLSSLSFHRS